MHLLREGQFSVATTFLEEALHSPPHPAPTPGTPNPATDDSGNLSSLQSQELQAKFSDMYRILHELKERNLHPAIEWAREHSTELENRGSNLEFELSKLQYLWLFQGHSINGLPDDENNGLDGALKYAKINFPRHQQRFSKDCQQLITAILSTLR